MQSKSPDFFSNIVDRRSMDSKEWEVSDREFINQNQRQVFEDEPLYLQRARKRFVNLAKQDPGRSRQSS